MTTLSEILAQIDVHAGSFELELSPDWLQGRSLFGGLQAALAVQAMRSLVPEQPLRSLQVNFIAPLAGRVRAQAAVLRAGKNTTQVQASLCGEAGMATQCMAIFGNPLSSAVEIKLPSPPHYPGSPLVFPYLAGITPAFTQHFGMRLCKGHPPFAGKATPASAFELDLRDPGPVSEAHVLALADVVPPLGLSYLHKPSFGSTLSWMLEILSEPASDESLQNWRLDSELLSARDGYTNQSSILYAPSGQAIALSRQCMLIFG